MIHQYDTHVANSDMGIVIHDAQWLPTGSAPLVRVES